MIASNTDRPDPCESIHSEPDIDPTVPTDPVVGSIAARCNSTHQVWDETGTVGSVGTVPRTVPALFARFAEPSKPTDEPEPVSPSEEEERIDEPIDDGPWIIDAEAAAELDEFTEVDFDDVPVCSCGRYCDVQKLDERWHCSHCNPADPEHRRKQTQRLLAAAERIRRESELTESNVTKAKPQP